MFKLPSFISTLRASLYASLVMLAGPLSAAISYDIPDSLSGTYELAFTTTSTGDLPFAIGTKTNFVINGANDTICYSGKTFTALNSTSSTITIAYYTYKTTDNTGTEFINIVTLDNNAFQELVYAKSGGAKTASGLLRGSKISNSTTCTTSAVTTAAPTISVDAQSVFSLAAEIYPTLFTNGSALATYQDFVYKYFADSKIYVGIKDNAIWVMGGSFGNTPTNKGTITAVLSSLQTAKANIVKAQTSTGGGTVVIPTGTYTLTVTGNYKASIAGQAISFPFSVSLPNMPAPSPSDTAAMTQLIQTSVGASGVANVKTTIINNTSSRVTFRVECTANLTGVGSVTYDLTYDYTK